MSADSGETAAGLSTTGGAWAPTPDEEAPGISRLPLREWVAPLPEVDRRYVLRRLRDPQTTPLGLAR